MQKIIPLNAFKDNYIWTILNDRNHAVIVDPGEAQPIITFLEENPQLRLSGVLITHKHWDHCNGVPDILEKYSVPVYASFSKEIPHVSFPMKENDIFHIEGFEKFKVIEIPGHTLEHIAYYGSGVLFCGDTLFTGGCGRIFEGTPPQMFETLQKISALPEKTLIYCGHEYTLANLAFAKCVEPNNKILLERIKESEKLRSQHLPTVPSTLKLEKETNPFLRCDAPEVIQSVKNYCRKDLQTPAEVFEYLRKWKNEFK